MRIRPGTARLTVAVGVAAALVVSVAACSSGTSSTSGTTITVGERPPADQKASRVAFDRQVKAFEKANPDITIKASTNQYDPQTFQTLLAGGNLPNVMDIPFTEPQTLIARGQLADITDAVSKAGIKGELNPTTLEIVQDSSKKIYGVPIGAYAVGLNYNRALFTQAGLNPDQPPQTWDEVRSAAKAIVEKTGQTGFAQMSNKNCGGWMFTAMTYAFGGRLENAKGTKAVFADTDGSADALKALHDMKWVDQTMGSQNLYDCDSIQQDFAAGKIGMYLKAPDDYTAAVTRYGLDPDSFGAAPMPTSGDTKRTTLTGGTVAIVSPKATDAQKLASVKWIAFSQLKRYTDKSAAVDYAKATKADGAPVAVPGLSVVGQSEYDQYLEWVKPYNNVPTGNFDAYLKAQSTQTIVPEPKTSAQTVYAALDSIIQKVLTDKDADITGLLKDAQTSVDAQLEQR